jgi:hypothetical protein
LQISENKIWGVQHLSFWRKYNTSTVKSILLDLIQVKDKKFVPAFYFGVQDTLVKKISQLQQSESLTHSIVFILSLFFDFI